MAGNVLNEHQARAVHARGHTLVVSVPGSGKTRLLVAKAVDILSKDKDAPLILVTFTRDAAEEMSARLTVEHGAVPKNVRIGTFHSLSMDLLKSRSRRKVNVLNPEKQTSLLWRAYSRVCGSATQDEWIPWETAVRKVEHLKSTLNPVIIDSTVTGRIYLAYQTLLADNHGMDFADLLLESVRGLRDGSIKPFPCRYLFVDEAQDTDEVQMAWIDCHIAAGGEVTMVGDDDQSIYSWRNALGYAGMLEFERRYRAQRITLSINYRSASNIIETANRLIHHNKDRLPKTIRSNTTRTGLVRYEQYRARDQEAEAVIEAVSSRPQEWVVLARANQQLDMLAGKMKQRNIPFHQPGVFQFWSRQHIARPLTTLWALALDGSGHPDESSGVEQLLSAVGVDEEFIRQRRPINFDQIMEFEQLLVLEDRKNFRAMLVAIAAWRQEARSTVELDIANLANAVYGWFKENAPLLEKDGTVRNKSNGLHARQMSIAAKIISKMRGTLRQRIEAIREPMKTEGPLVTLLTIHATKGREFDRVWILGVEDGSLPHKDSLNLEEERRLCYVAMTRAREELVFSSVYRDDDGKRAKESTTPSMFLYDAGILKPVIASTA